MNNEETKKISRLKLILGTVLVGIVTYAFLFFYSSGLLNYYGTYGPQGWFLDYGAATVSIVVMALILSLYLYDGRKSKS